MDLRGKKYLRKKEECLHIFKRHDNCKNNIYPMCRKTSYFKEVTENPSFFSDPFSYGEFQARKLNTKLIVIIMAGRYVVHFSVGLLLQRDFIIGSFAVS